MTTVVFGQGAAGEEPWPVSVSNLPAVQPVSDNGGSLTVDGSVSVSSLPALAAGSNTIGKVDQRALWNMRSWSQFYNLRSQRFIATTGYVTCTTNTVQNLAWFRNPSGSGKVIMLDQAEFGATVNNRFTRYGGGTLALVGTPTKRAVAATDGSAATAVAELYIGGNNIANHNQFSVSVAGTVRKVATMQAYSTYQILQVGGTAIIRPGAHSYWTLDEIAGGGSGDYTAFIDFEWVEMAEADFTALETAMAAMPLY